MLILLGVVAGGFLGGILAHGFDGVVAGAVVGGFATYFWRNRANPGSASNADPDRIALLERKVQYLYDQLQSAQLRLSALEKGSAPAERSQVLADEPAVPAEAFAVAPDAAIEASAAAVAPGADASPPVDAALAPAAQEQARPITAAPAAISRDPSVFDHLINAAREWFTGGNTVVRVGIVILFFGLAFLLKYAYDHSQVPPALRIAAVALGGAVLLYLGWRLRTRRAAYAQALQGGGIGALYLTVFGALKLYQLLPAGPAFGLMICIAAFSAVLAVLQNAQALAILGAAGGFLAPVLASTGEGSHVMLFSYYLLLNAGILAIAWFKAWRMLNFVGFFFTFGIALAWGIRSYQPEQFSSTEPFLIGFFLMYLAVSVLFALRQAPRLTHYLDGTLVFGLPIVAFGMQVKIMQPFEYGAAWSALILGFGYLLLARLLWGRHQDGLRALVEAFLALGVVFASLAIPLALDGRWTSAAWALEGAAMIWVGVKQGRLSARLFGVLLQVAAAIAFLDGFDAVLQATPVANSFFLGALFIGVAGLFSSFMLERHEANLRTWERWFAKIGFVWGLAWWALAGVSEIDRQLLVQHKPHAVLLFATVSIALLTYLHDKLDWRMARWGGFGLLPVAFCMLFADAGEGVPHPLSHAGWLAWPMAFVCHLWLLRPGREFLRRVTILYHAAGLWLLAALATWEWVWWTEHWTSARSVWALVSAMVPAAVLVWLLGARAQRLPWPVAGQRSGYLLAGCLPLLLYLALWLALSNGAHNGDPAPLPYVPVINPLDLAQLAVLLVALVWFRGCVGAQVLDANKSTRTFYVVLGVAGFMVANAMLLRALHHWAGVPFNFDQMMSSMLVQAAFSIFWTLLALGTMVIASRLKRRALWMTGAGLMAMVVVKLFLIDLSAIGGVERIVSFIGVGVLMLVVGYLSPVPPKRAEGAA